MAYYIGTKQECEDYDQVVTIGENYQGTTTSWASVIPHPTEDKYAIVAHENYSSELEMLEVLTSNWTTNPEI
jgi:hypothetical protein